jgi:hypothetical protein
VASRLRDTAGRLADGLARTGAGSPLAAMAAARELSAATGEALQESADRARAAGHSWREIGDVLGTTRQAAFQRFGHPVDPRTGAPMRTDVPPGAADRAAAIVTCLTEGRWEDARRDFNARMREGGDAGRLASGWARTVAMIGRYEGMGEPFAHRAGDHTVVEVPLHFEAGQATGRVIFGDDGKIAGLWLRPAAGAVVLLLTTLASHGNPANGASPNALPHVLPVIIMCVLLAVQIGAIRVARRKSAL